PTPPPPRTPPPPPVPHATASFASPADANTGPPALVGMIQPRTSSLPKGAATQHPAAAATSPTNGPASTSAFPIAAILSAVPTTWPSIPHPPPTAAAPNRRDSSYAAMPPSAAGPVPVSSYLSKRTSFPFLASDRSASPVAPPQQFPPRGGSANIASWFSLQHPSTGVAYTANSGGITASASVIPEEDLPPPSVLEELDAAQDLLIRLERENASLRLDPKSVLVEQGSLMAHLDTMQSLSEYHLKLSSEMREEDVAFWKSVIDDHQASMQKIPHLLVVKIRSGIPPQLRSKIWQLMAGAEPEALASVYNNLLQEESPADRIIKRDIPRTFPKLDLFKDEGGVGQKSLYNLLKAYSIYDADCGYCQGLSFVVAPLILQNMSEVECFSVFVRLMEETPSRSSYRRYALRSLFTPQMPGLHVILFQHSELVRLCLPHLFNHFVAHGVMADTYASPWFLTLFTYNFPLPLVFRIFDIIFAEGATETMMRFSIAILKRNQHRILAEQDLEGILEILKGDSLYKVYEDDPERVVQD
ncbi:hypothetical protein HK405_015319, partial [Cladochytrium tenue]